VYVETVWSMALFKEPCMSKNCVFRAEIVNQIRFNEEVAVGTACHGNMSLQCCT